MKKLLFFFLVAGLFIATSCDDGKKGKGDGKDSTKKDSAQAKTDDAKPSDNLVGTWSLSDVAYDMGVEMTPEMKAMMDPMINAMKEKMNMTFNGDASYSMVAPNPMKEGEILESGGSWKLTEDGKMLITQETGKEKVDSLTLTELSAAKMVITQKIDEKGSVTMTMSKN